ncbi:hypothetical protein [Sphingomonas sp. 28-63-12]|uniref:hypothetical protein n=1 Tax=Sphingomonas sp. 28-63-12 TaxID=1970434 RepID=UPI000BCD393A|nr:MAG: hypothetical protein B7Y47_11940 [Sphingomonas sp. 28-63-12]
MIRPSSTIGTILAAAILLSGCSYIGPRSLIATRPLYNQAIAQTNDQELLLNLVRIRYRDTTYFTSVERIAASLELNMSIGSSGSLSRTASTAAKDTIGRVLSLGPGTVAMNEKPTIFYAPLEGEKFVRQMMTPINPDILFLLVRSGWSIDRAFSLGVIEMNGLKNAPTASGPAPSRAPEFHDFADAAKMLRVLQRDNRLDLVKTTSDKPGIELRFTRGAASSDEALHFKSLTGIDPSADRIRIVLAGDATDKMSLAITTRPVMAALHFLATGVEVPVRDLDAGLVRRTTRADGTPFDWQEMLGGVFRVQVSDHEPQNATTMVRYRGSWFYIADNDLETKSTFELLTQVIALHSAPPSTTAPIAYSIGK